MRLEHSTQTYGRDEDRHGDREKIECGARFATKVVRHLQGMRDCPRSQERDKSGADQTEDEHCAERTPSKRRELGLFFRSQALCDRQRESSTESEVEEPEVADRCPDNSENAEAIRTHLADQDRDGDDGRREGGQRSRQIEQRIQSQRPAAHQFDSKITSPCPYGCGLMKKLWST